MLFTYLATLSLFFAMSIDKANAFQKSFYLLCIVNPSPLLLSRSDPFEGRCVIENVDSIG